MVPFTNVGLNKSATFYHLDLLPQSGMYYATIRAYSTSYATAEVTSNGLRTGFPGGVIGNALNNNKSFETKGLFLLTQ